MSLKRGASSADQVRDIGRGYLAPAEFIVSTGLEVLSGRNQSKAPSKRQAAELVAAGFIPPDPSVKGRAAAPLGWTTPTGEVISRDAARRVARTLPTPPLVPEPAPLPTGEELFEDLLRRREYRPPDRLPRTGEVFDDLLRRPRIPPPEPAPVPSKLPSRLPAILGRVGGIIGGILYPSDTADSDLYPPGEAIPRPERPPPPPPPPVTVPVEPSPAPVETSPRPTPRPADEFPRGEPPTSEPVPPPIVLLPVPDAAERSEPRADPVPTAAPAPSPASVPFQFPDLLPFPFQLPLPKRPAARITNRLPTITNPLLTMAPGASVAPLPRGLTQVQPAALASGGPPGSSSRCSCPPKRQRKPKKQREECFEGFYREKRTGIQKTPRRKVPCQ